MKKRRGFTLIELLAVIAILAVILLISVPMVLKNLERAKQKSYLNQVEFFKKGAQKYVAL